MNIFAYRGRYRTVTGTRYIPYYKSVRLPNMHASRPGANRPHRFKPRAMHITLGGENCRLVCKLGTCIPSRVHICLSIYSSMKFRAYLRWPVKQRLCGSCDACAVVQIKWIQCTHIHTRVCKSSTSYLERSHSNDVQPWTRKHCKTGE